MIKWYEKWRTRRYVIELNFWKNKQMIQRLNL